MNRGQEYAQKLLLLLLCARRHTTDLFSVANVAVIGVVIVAVAVAIISVAAVGVAIVAVAVAIIAVDVIGVAIVAVAVAICAVAAIGVAIVVVAVAGCAQDASRQPQWPGETVAMTTQFWRQRLTRLRGDGGG